MRRGEDLLLLQNLEELQETAGGLTGLIKKAQAGLVGRGLLRDGELQEGALRHALPTHD
jgi:hypothetical protein